MVVFVWSFNPSKPKSWHMANSWDFDKVVKTMIDVCKANGGHSVVKNGGANFDEEK